MANEENIEKPVPVEAPKEESGKKFNPKLIIIGLPVFIVQLIIVYFVTANILLSKISHVSPQDSVNVSGEKAAEQVQTATTKDLGKFIFSIEDIIVNPSDTDGKRLLLTSIGFDLGDELLMQEFKSKEILLKDAILTTLTGKTLAQLGSAEYRDSIKTEIYGRVKSLLPASKINTVYISKFIIQ